jgi:hypothetical protein
VVSVSPGIASTRVLTRRSLRTTRAVSRRRDIVNRDVLVLDRNLPAMHSEEECRGSNREPSATESSSAFWNRC